MAIELKMPALSPTMEEGTLAKWLVKEGDEVSSGDILAEIETDKATMEFEAVDEGVIANILVQEGAENVAVGTVIATIVGEGEESGDAQVAAPAAPEPAATAPVPAAEASPEKPERVPVPSDPDIPAGTDMISTSVREALRDAIAEEMRKDELVFVMEVVDTAYDKKKLTEIAEVITKLPTDKKFLRKIERLIDQRHKMFFEKDQLDWAMGELLAYGSLLKEGYDVRMSGQDVERGTFSHRHAVVKVEDSEEEVLLLNNLKGDQGDFYIYNSLLSEYGVDSR